MTIFTTDQTMTYNLAAYEILIVPEAISLMTTSTYGLSATANAFGTNTVVAGSIAASLGGISLTATAAGDDNEDGTGAHRITISETGQVNSYIAVEVSGISNSITNAGNLSGIFGIIANGSDSYFSNSGTISASFAGFTFNISTSGNNVLTNSGSIIATDAILLNVLSETSWKNTHIDNSGIIEGSSHAIYVATGLNMLNLVNSGTILGAVEFDHSQSRLRLENTGTIGGDINMGTSADRIDNFGEITGDLSFDDWWDILINGGTIIGHVDMGDGTDQVQLLEGSVITGELSGGDGEDFLFLQTSTRGITSCSKPWRCKAVATSTTAQTIQTPPARRSPATGATMRSPAAGAMT